MMILPLALMPLRQQNYFPGRFLAMWKEQARPREHIGRSEDGHLRQYWQSWNKLSLCHGFLDAYISWMEQLKNLDTLAARSSGFIVEWLTAAPSTYSDQ